MAVPAGAMAPVSGKICSGATGIMEREDTKETSIKKSTDARPMYARGNKSLMPP